jgi:hypothetical protein
VWARYSSAKRERKRGSRLQPLAPVMCVSNPASALLHAPQSRKDRRRDRKYAISALESLR